MSMLKYFLKNAQNQEVLKVINYPSQSLPPMFVNKETKLKVLAEAANEKCDDEHFLCQRDEDENFYKKPEEIICVEPAFVSIPPQGSQ